MPPVTTTVIGLTLGAAILHALWNAFVKRGSDRLLILTTVIFTNLLMGLVLIPFVTPPHPDSWPWIFLSILCHGGYYFFLLQAYRVGDLSLVYPISRGMSPLLVTLGSALFAEEYLPNGAVIGVVIVGLAICTLAFDRGLPWKGDRRPLMYALITSVFIAAYTVVDGIGVRLSLHPFGYIAYLFVFDGIAITGVTLYLRWGKVRVFLRAQWSTCMAGGIAAGIGYGLVIYAMNFGAMAVVSALRETSVVFATMLGIMFLKEPLNRRRLMASLAIAGGIALITLGK